jgi:hypothetical protein
MIIFSFWKFSVAGVDLVGAGELEINFVALFRDGR